MQVQNHYPLRPLGGDYEETFALFAIRPKRKAVIFIHGYPATRVAALVAPLVVSGVRLSPISSATPPMG